MGNHFLTILLNLLMGVLHKILQTYKKENVNELNVSIEKIKLASDSCRSTEEIIYHVCKHHNKQVDAQRIYKTLELNDKSTKLSNILRILLTLALREDILVGAYGDKLMKIRNKLKPFDILDENNFNILMISSCIGEIEIVKLLCKFNIYDVNYEVNGITAASLALKNKKLEVFFVLMINNALFPENFSIEILNIHEQNVWAQKIFDFIMKLNSLNSSYKEEDILENVKYIKKEYPNLKYFYNTKNESLLEILMKFEHFELCDSLHKLGLEISSYKSFTEIIKPKELRDKTVIKCSDKQTNLAEKENNCIKILEGNAHFIASEEHPRIMKSTYFKIIQKILRVLQMVPLIFEFMKLLAAYNHKKVIYDFSNSRQKPCVDNKKYLNRNEVIFCCEDFLKFPIEMITGDKSYEDYIKVKKETARQPQRNFASIARPPRSSFFDFSLYGPGSHNEEVPEIPLEQIPTKEKLAACYASVAHELTHWAFQLTYENHCKPYAVEDALRKSVYEQVLHKTSFTQEMLKIISRADDKFYEAELIVRIPELYTYYIDYSSEILKLKKEFQALFDFYNNYVLPDIKEASNIIYGIKKVEEINLHCGVEEIVQEENFRLKNEIINIDYKFAESQVLLIISNCHILVLTAFRQIYFVIEESRKFKNSTVTNLLQKKYENEENFFIFVRQNQIFIKDFREPILDAFNSCKKSILIVYCKPDITLLTLMEILQKLNTFSRVIFITNGLNENILPENFKKLILNYDWESLEDYTKERLLKQEIEFQGRKVLVEDVFDKESYNDFLNYFINEKELNVGKSSNIPKLDYHIERKFVEFDVKLATEKIMEDNEGLSIQQLLDTTKEKTFNFISDHSGSGKTIELMNIANVIKNKSPSKFVFFVCLDKVFNKDKMKKILKSLDIKIENNSDESSMNNFLNSFAKFFLDLDNYEAKVFKLYIKNKNVVILFDEFDDLSSELQDFCENLFEKLHALQGNQFWVATRDNYKPKLKSDTAIFKFGALTAQQRKEWLIKMGTGRSLEAIQNNVNRIQDIGEFLKLGVLMAIENPKEFENKSIFHIFNVFFEKSLSKIKTKMNFAEIMKLLENLALEKIKHFSSDEFSDLKNISKLKIIKITKVDNEFRVKFFNRAFADFFFAKYCLRCIQVDCDDQFHIFFIKALKENKFELVRKLLNTNLDIPQNISKQPEQSTSKLRIRRFADSRSDISQTVNSGLLILKNSEFKKLFLNEIMNMENSAQIIKNGFSFNVLLEVLLKLTEKNAAVLTKMWVEDNNNKSIFLDLLDAQNFASFKIIAKHFKGNVLKLILQDEEKNILHVIAKRKINIVGGLGKSYNIFEQLRILKQKEYSDSEDNNSDSGYAQSSTGSVGSQDSLMTLMDEAENYRLESRSFSSISLNFPDMPKSSYSQRNLVINEGLIDVLIEIRSCFDRDEFTKVLQAKDTENHSVLFYAAQNDLHDFLFVYFQDLERYLTDEEIKQFFIEENIFSVVNNATVLGLLLEIVETLFTHEELFKVMRAKKVTVENPLLASIKNSNAKVFVELMKFYNRHNLIDVKKFSCFFIYALIQNKRNVAGSEIFIEVKKILNRSFTKGEFFKNILQDSLKVDTTKKSLNYDKLITTVDEIFFDSEKVIFILSLIGSHPQIFNTAISEIARDLSRRNDFYSLPLEVKKLFKSILESGLGNSQIENEIEMEIMEILNSDLI